MGAVFAQQKAPAAPAAKEASNAVAWDLFPLLMGIVASEKHFTDINFSFAYERLLAPHFSLGPDIDMNFYVFDNRLLTRDFICFYFSAAVEGRYYPQANFDKFFVGTTLGFNFLSLDGEKADDDHGGFSGLFVALKMGYKLKFTNFLYMEPSLSYVLSKSSSYIPLPTPRGWQGGLRLGFTF
jgi:hypothetical protein